LLVIGGPYSPADPTTVVLPDLPAFTDPFPQRHGNTTHAVSAAAQRFELGSRDNRLVDFAVLGDVDTDCGFFSAEVYDAIGQGSILAAHGVPSASRICASFSVYSFLRFRPDTDNPPSIPSAGWDDLLDAKRFIAAIQWFLTDAFGVHIGSRCFFYKALHHLRQLLESPYLAAAWSTIDRHTFAVVMVTTVHTLWLSLLH
jgi:hypothetical protein